MQYVYTIVSNLPDYLISRYALPLFSALVSSVLVIVNLNRELTEKPNRAALLILFFICFVYGPLIDLLVFLQASYIFIGGLPKAFVFLLLDFVIVSVPAALLLLCLLDYDFRIAFLISLLPVIPASFALKFIFGLSNCFLFR